MKNKRGWIRIVEAVTALLLITGALLVVISGGYLKEDISEKVYDAELTVLKEISRDIAMRTAIVAVQSDSSVSWDNFDSNSLGTVKTKIEERIPSYLECEAKVCNLDVACELEIDIDVSVYARSIAIAATSDEYSPKQLKLFCWEKT